MKKQKLIWLSTWQQRLWDAAKIQQKVVITSASGHKKDVVSFSENNHEEADTLTICFDVSAASRNSADVQLTFSSPDTDVLV